MAFRVLGSFKPHGFRESGSLVLGFGTEPQSQQIGGGGSTAGGGGGGREEKGRREVFFRWFYGLRFYGLGLKEGGLVVGSDGKGAGWRPAAAGAVLGCHAHACAHARTTARVHGCVHSCANARIRASRARKPACANAHAHVRAHACTRARVHARTRTASRARHARAHIHTNTTHGRGSCNERYRHDVAAIETPRFSSD